jgi:drug/metabolite transporter (DMT)-like permease
MTGSTPALPGPARLSLSSVFLVVLLAFIWGLNWPAIRIAVAEISPWTFRALCLIAGAFTLFSFAAARKARLSIPRSEIIPLMVVSFLNVTCFHMFTAFGLTMVEASRGVILAFTFPLWSVLLGTVVLREKMSVSRLCALMFGAGALALLIGPDIASLEQSPVGGFLLVCAALAWAAATVLIKRRQWSLASSEFAAWQLGIGAVPVVVGALLVDDAPDFTELSAPGWLAFLYTSAVAVAFGQWLWFRILHILPSAIASISTLAIPVVGVFSSSLLLGEILGWREIVALVLVLAALFLVLVGFDGFRMVKQSPHQEN